jgi:predicted dehydrogenase
MSAGLPVRVGIVGSGGWTRHRIIPRLQAIPGVQVVAVANRTRTSSERASTEFGIPALFPEWRSLVTSTEIDAVYVGGWPHLHHAVTLAALAAGKHVLVEAHMAANAAEAREMLAAAKARPDLVAQVVTVGRLVKAERTVRRLLHEGFLGELLAVDLRVSEGFPDPTRPWPRRQQRALAGDNALYTGVWYEELMRWVGEIVSVCAMGRTFVGWRPNEEGHLAPATMPDHLGVLGELACGAQAHLLFSGVCGLAGPNNVWLFGREGTLFFDQSAQELYGGRKGQPSLERIEIPAAECGGWHVTEEWIAAIRGERPIGYTTFEDGVKHHEFSDAISRSLASGQRVSVLR